MKTRLSLWQVFHEITQSQCYHCVHSKGRPSRQKCGIMASIMQRWLRGEASASAAKTSSEPKEDPKKDVMSKSELCKAKNEVMELSTPKDSEAKGKGKGRKRAGESIDFESPEAKPKKKKSNTGGKV